MSGAPVPPGRVDPADLAAAPYAHDFYALMRAYENAAPHLPRLGTALRPSDERLRVGQDVELTFAPAAISSYRPATESRVARVGVRFMGLFGPHGPMPLHLTEYVHGREHHHGDRTLSAFADVFHHRMILLLYRAWAQARPALWLDRDADARFDTFVGALIGMAASPWWGRDAVSDAGKRRNAGLLAGGVKHADGLRDILSDYLDVPISIESHVGHWMAIEPRDRTRLGDGGPPNQLGNGAVLGGAAWDRQFKFRVRVGPLDWEQYLRFLPDGEDALVVRDWVRQYVGLDLAWDLSVSLRGGQVPQPRLGGINRLGLSCWLGGFDPQAAHADLIYAPESIGRNASERRTQ